MLDTIHIIFIYIYIYIGDIYVCTQMVLTENCMYNHIFYHLMKTNLKSLSDRIPKEKTFSLKQPFWCAYLLIQGQPVPPHPQRNSSWEKK